MLAFDTKMGTPPKNAGRFFESPYAKHLQKYPSQSEEFIPNELGKNWVSSSTPLKQQHQSITYQHNLSHWRRGSNRHFNANRADTKTNCGNNLKAGGGYRNCQNICNPQQAQRHSNIGSRQQPYQGQQFNKSECSFTNDYYHPSMLDDPWKALLDRHHAIKKSYIDAPSFKNGEQQERKPSYEEKPLPQKDSTTAIPSNAMTTPTGVKITKIISP